MTARLADDKIKKREINGLLSALDHFDLSEGLLLTGDESGVETVGKKTIRFQPVWQWLLQRE